MKTPINFEQLWETLNSGQQGYLVLDPKTGLSSLTHNTRKRHFRGRVSQDPLAPSIFFLQKHELDDAWSLSPNITCFCSRINWQSIINRRSSCLEHWASFFKYKDLGKYKSHGLPGVYDLLFEERIGELDQYFEIDLSDLTKLGDDAYTLIGLIWKELRYVGMNPTLFLKPEGTTVEWVGMNQNSVNALKVPERFRAMIEAFTTVLTL